MGTNSNDQPVSAAIIGDAHFHVAPDAAEQVRQQAFLALLHDLAGIEHLILLGDIFDFWFDYPHFLLRGYEPLLHGLDGLRRSGTRIHFVGGNHDIWAAGYFHERFGSERHGGPLPFRFGGQRIRCVHGDGMLEKDLLYRGFRGLVRNPAAVRVAKTLHPEALFAFSTWLSGASRAATRDEADGIEAKAARYLERCLAGSAGAPDGAGPDWDVLVMGHVHHPFRIDRNGRTLLSLGGWLEPLNYGLVREGVVVHTTYAPAAATTPR